MRINRSARGTGETLSLFRSKLTPEVNPVGAAQPDENDLNERLFESMFARIQRLEEELERREQARFGVKSRNAAPWLANPVIEQDTQAPTKKDLKQAIASYQRTSQFSDEDL